MTERIIAMSYGEIERLKVIEKVVEKRLKQLEGAALLGLSKRQMIRLIKVYRCKGATALVSKRRGRISNRKHSNLTKQSVKELVLLSYADFGPTLASEKVHERHGIKVNKETMRQWLIEWGLWKAKRHKRVRVHQSRARRPCLGELVQIDGSPHDWFEGRGPYCCLLVFVDDATSKIMKLHFEPSETTAGYFKSTREYIERCGRPIAFYSDKDSIFRVNRLLDQNTGITQFGRAMQELGIEIICAHSPQAKGRVERMNGILQDRLIKEMRLQGISDIETANTFLPTFMEDYNRRFAKTPAGPTDVHRRELPEASVLDRIFSYQYERKLSKNLEMSYNNMIYQVKIKGGIGYGLRYTKIVVCEDMEGVVTLLYKGRVLNYTCQAKQKKAAEIVMAKELNAFMEAKQPRSAGGHKPSANHPWRQYWQKQKLAGT